MPVNARVLTIRLIADYDDVHASPLTSLSPLPARTPIILVGNKKDLARERAVSYEDGKHLADEMKAKFVEVSAKDNTSVNNLFQSLIDAIEKKNLGDPGESTVQKEKTSCILS